jgi:hypothetical protein
MHIGYWWERDGKRPLGRPRRRWVDNIKMDHREIGWDDMDWLDLARDRNQCSPEIKVIIFNNHMKCYEQV